MRHRKGLGPYLSRAETNGRLCEGDIGSSGSDKGTAGGDTGNYGDDGSGTGGSSRDSDRFNSGGGGGGSDPDPDPVTRRVDLSEEQRRAFAGTGSDLVERNVSVGGGTTAAGVEDVAPAPGVQTPDTSVDVVDSVAGVASDVSTRIGNAADFVTSGPNEPSVGDPDFGDATVDTGGNSTVDPSQVSNTVNTNAGVEQPIGDNTRQLKTTESQSREVELTASNQAASAINQAVGGANEQVAQATGVNVGAAVEDTTGRDLGLDTDRTATVRRGEQFGNFDWSLGLGDPNEDEVEQTLDDVSEGIRSRSEAAGEALFDGGVSPVTQGLEAAGRDNLAAQYDSSVRSFGEGIVTGTGGLAAQVPQLATEAPEFAGFAATNPGTTADRLQSEVPRRAALLGESASANPAQFSGEVVGSLGASRTAFKLTQGTRASTATRAAIQPGEEVLRAAGRRGVTGTRRLSDAIGDSNFGSERAQTSPLLGAGRLRDDSGSSDTTVEIEDTGPLAAVENDVRTGLDDIEQAAARGRQRSIDSEQDIDTETQTITQDADVRSVSQPDSRTVNPSTQTVSGNRPTNEFDADLSPRETQLRADRRRSLDEGTIPGSGQPSQRLGTNTGGSISQRLQSDLQRDSGVPEVDPTTADLRVVDAQAQQTPTTDLRAVVGESTGRGQAAAGIVGGAVGLREQGPELSFDSDLGGVTTGDGDLADIISGDSVGIDGQQSRSVGETADQQFFERNDAGATPDTNGRSETGVSIESVVGSAVGTQTDSRLDAGVEGAFDGRTDTATPDIAAQLGFESSGETDTPTRFDGDRRGESDGRIETTPPESGGRQESQRQETRTETEPARETRRDTRREIDADLFGEDGEEDEDEEFLLDELDATFDSGILSGSEALQGFGR